MSISEREDQTRKAIERSLKPLKTELRALSSVFEQLDALVDRKLNAHQAGSDREKEELEKSLRTLQDAVSSIKSHTEELKAKVDSLD